MSMLTEPATELEDSTALLRIPAALRAKAASDGYLFFRSLLPTPDVMRVRRDVMTVLDGQGWLAEGHAPDEGVVDDDAINAVAETDMRLDIGVSAEGYFLVQQVQSLHALPHHPALMSVYETLFGEDVFVHPRHIVRIMTSHRSLRPTPPHQDFPLVQGSQNTWTCWFPLGDCASSLGPLTVMPGSHRKGALPIHLAEGAGGIGAQLCQDEVAWAAADFRAGDVLTFPALTVHKATPSTEPGFIRLSMDVRYQPVSEPIEEQSLGNHADRSWEDIYAEWPDDAIQYYWRRDAPRLSPWDDSLVQPGRRIC